jgi:uncharacterized protein (TIGR02145 family)
VLVAYMFQPIQSLLFRAILLFSMLPYLLLTKSVAPDLGNSYIDRLPQPEIKIKNNTMKHILFSVIATTLLSFAATAQVAINTDGTAPDNSAMLDVKSTSKGVLIPRMTFDQMNAIQNPHEGLIVFCTDCVQGNTGTIAIFSAGKWNTFTPCITNSPTSETHSWNLGTINWDWSSVSGSLGYKWNTTNNYGTAIDMGANSYKSEPGLSCGTQYTRYVWAYFTCGTSAPVSLIYTSPVAPSGVSIRINTPYMTKITWVWSGNGNVNIVGYKWNSVNDYSTATDVGSATSYTQTGLSCATMYNSYVWAYGPCGVTQATTLSQMTSDCCGQPYTDTRNYKVYNTVAIGNQCWMKENMNIGNRINGSLGQANNAAIEKYCYGDLESNCDIYGGLYQWDEMMQYTTTSGGQGICPDGWHIPTITEYSDMITYLGGSSVAGGKLKEDGLTRWALPNTGATNSSGFTGLPGGGYVSGFHDLTTYGYFWSSDHTYDIEYLMYNSAGSGQTTGTKSYGYSVRCIRF